MLEAYRAKLTHSPYLDGFGSKMEKYWTEKELLLGAHAEGGGRQRHSQPDLPAALRRAEPLARRAKPKEQKRVTDPS